MKYSSMVPATDWFFVHRDSDSATWTVHHLAVWAMDEDGKVTGLLAVSGPALSGGRTTAKLVEPPPIKGEYLHRDELSEDMLQRLRRR